MKKLFAISALLIAMAISTAATAQELPNKRQTLNTIVKVNDYFMKKYADFRLPSFTDAVRPSNIWTRGVYYEGLMEFYSIYPREEYYRYAFDWAEFHKWGFRNGNTTRNADDYCAAQAYIDLYKLEPESYKLRNVRAQTDMLLNTPQVNDWTWIDAIQMGMPVLAKMGSLTGDSRYFEKMYEMYAWSKNNEGGTGLWNAKEGLWWRDKSFLPPYKEPNGKNCYWSRGNGWVFMTYPRILKEIPANEPHRKEYIEDYKAMAKALLDCQREDGLWNVSLHDPNNFGGKEVTGTSMFIYGLAWGINNGILDAKTYLPATIKAWNSMVADAVHDNGFLGYVQGTGKEPKDSQPVTYTKVPNFEDFGIGAFIMAGTEIYKLK